MMASRQDLNPNLIGWFAVAFSKELKQEQVIRGMLANKPYMLSRSKVGTLAFNNKTDIILEQNGIIYAWNHPHGLAPHWYIPILDETHWTAYKQYQLIARTHPQEVYENSIDISHFPIVHGFTNNHMKQEPLFNAHCMSVRYALYRQNPFLSFGKLLFSEFELQLHGLGCAHTHIHIPLFDMQVRMFALATPTFKNQVKIRIAVAISKNIKIPFKNFFLPILLSMIHKNIVHDFCQDIAIWENKCYYKTPLLVKGDGPIMRFRQWCQQFEIKE